MLLDTQLADLVLATREIFLERGSNRIETILELQSYEFMDEWMVAQRETMDGGDDIKWQVQLYDDENASFRGMYGEDSYAFKPTLAEASAKWTTVNNYWLFDVDEIAENAGDEVKVTNLMNSRRLASMKGLANKQEKTFWRSLPSSSADLLTPRGLLYYVVKGTTGQAGWIGQNPTGHSDCAGIDASSTDNSGWCNYSARGSGYYSDWNAELVDTLADMWDLLSFKAPTIVEDLVKDRSVNKFRLYTTRATRRGMAKLARSNNDQLGAELNAFAGSMSFNKQPFRWAPALDTDTTDPIYMLNMDKWKVFVMKGVYMREMGPDKVANRHTVRVVNVDTRFQVGCTNRHLQGVCSK